MSRRGPRAKEGFGLINRTRRKATPDSLLIAENSSPEENLMSDLLCSGCWRSEQFAGDAAAFDLPHTAAGLRHGR